MLRGELAKPDYKPQFSGHATFPLRYGWLKKGFDAVLSEDNQVNSKKIFLSEDAISKFGVGKNMVESIRHWCQATGVIIEGVNENSLATTKLGRAIFSSDGVDPYMEHSNTLWLIHWKLCGLEVKTTWHWAFNYYSSPIFERENLVKQIVKLSENAGWKRVSPNTIKRDVECFVRTYATRPLKNKEAHEDALECPLAELGLIRSTGTRDGFRFVRGKKASLHDSVFLYAVVDFWQRASNTSHLSFESLMHEPGSPGRVFLLDENEMSDRLAKIDVLSEGKIRWSETAGLKQVIRTVEFDEIDLLGLIESGYGIVDNREVA